MFVARRLMEIGAWLLFVVCYALFVVLLLVRCWLLVVVRCSLFVVC